MSTTARVSEMLRRRQREPSWAWRVQSTVAKRWESLVTAIAGGWTLRRLGTVITGYNNKPLRYLPVPYPSESGSLVVLAAGS